MESNLRFSSLRALVVSMLLLLIRQALIVEAYGTTGGSRNDGKTDLSLNAGNSLSATLTLTLCATALVFLVI